MKYYEKPELFYSLQMSEEIRQLHSIWTPRGPQGVLLLSKLENSTLNIMGHIPGAARANTEIHLEQQGSTSAKDLYKHTLGDIALPILIYLKEGKGIEL